MSDDFGKVMNLNVVRLTPNVVYDAYVQFDHRFFEKYHTCWCLVKQDPVVSDDQSLREAMVCY